MHLFGCRMQQRRMASAVPPVAIMLLFALALADVNCIAIASGCPLTQFRCTTGRCVNLNVFCDGRNDCGDNSDEPPKCTRKPTVTISSFI